MESAREPKDVNGTASDAENDATQQELPVTPDAAPAAEERSETAGELAEKLKAELLYQRAEFDNTRKRLLREQETAIRFANEKILREFVSVADLLTKALDSGRQLGTKTQGGPMESEFGGFLTGIEMTLREMVQVFGRAGAELIGEVGEKFDPARHEAITQMPVAKDKANTVLAVVQKGCFLGGRCVKPAQVVVGVAEEDLA